MENRVFNFLFIPLQNVFRIPLDPSVSFQKNKLTIFPFLFLRPKILTEIVKKIKDFQNQKLLSINPNQGLIQSTSNSPLKSNPESQLPQQDDQQKVSSFLTNLVTKLEKKIDDSEEELSSQEYTFFMNALQFIVTGKVCIIF